MTMSLKLIKSNNKQLRKSKQTTGKDGSAQ